MGGEAPSDLLIPEDTLNILAKTPLDFIIGVALKSNYRWSEEEIAKMETMVKKPVGTALNRVARRSVVVWTPREEEGEEKRKVSLWSGGKPLEGLVNGSVPMVLGGSNTFRPLPLQREGPYSTMMWEATFPEGFSLDWLALLSDKLTQELGEVMWTISRRYVSGFDVVHYKLTEVQQNGEEIQKVDTQDGW